MPQVFKSVLRNIMAIIEARSAEVVAKWTSFLAKHTISAEILSHPITPPKTAPRLG